jgi:hypothetical protein
MLSKIEPGPMGLWATLTAGETKELVDQRCVKGKPFDNVEIGEACPVCGWVNNVTKMKEWV